MEVSQVRRRLMAAVERARRAAQQRRERAAGVQKAYETFLADVAVPVTRLLATALKAEGYPFTVGTPEAGVRLSSEKRRDDYIELGLDTAADPPAVVGRVSYVRGSRTLAEERPVKPGSPPQAITEDDVLEFYLRGLEPWIE